MKKCDTCKEFFDRSAFARYRSAKDGLQKRCRECQKKYRYTWYNFNGGREVMRARNKRESAKTLKWYKELKETFSCKICGESHPATLDLHHRDPSVKDMSVSEMIKGWSRKRILQEIEKCDVLCSNCHRKLHYELRMAAYASGEATPLSTE